MGKVSLEEIDRILKNPPEPPKKGFLGIRKRQYNLVFKEKDALLKKKESDIIDQTKILSREQYQWNKRKKRVEEELSILKGQRDSVTKYLDEKQLAYWNGRAYLSLYTNPKYVLRKMRDVSNLKNLRRNARSAIKLISMAMRRIIKRT